MRKSLVVLSFLVSCAFCSYQNLQFGSYQNPRINQIGTQKQSGAVAPHWDIETQSLYYVNFGNNGSEPVMFRYSHDEDKTYAAYLSGVYTLMFILPVASKERNLFVVGAKKNVQIIRWDGRSNQATLVRNSFALDVNDPSTVTGYGRTSPSGRYFGGVNSRTICSNTTDFSPYPVYRYDRQKGVTRVIMGTYTIGIAFNPNTRKMNLIAPCRAMITDYDWDPETGDICNGRVVFSFNEAGFDTSGANEPLGLEIDTNGLLYTTLQSGVVVIDPRRRTVVNRYTLPVQGASGVAFGGPNLDILFVTAVGNIVNADTARTQLTVTAGSSLYKISGTGARTFVGSAARLQI